MLKKYFSIFPDKTYKQIYLRHFKIYSHKLNTSKYYFIYLLSIEIITLIKFLSGDIYKDKVAHIFEPSDLQLELYAFKRVKIIYEDFLNTFATTIDTDQQMLLE